MLTCSWVGGTDYLMIGGCPVNIGGCQYRWSSSQESSMGSVLMDVGGINFNLPPICRWWGDDDAGLLIDDKVKVVNVDVDDKMLMAWFGGGEKFYHMIPRPP